MYISTQLNRTRIYNRTCTYTAQHVIKKRRPTHGYLTGNHLSLDCCWHSSPMKNSCSHSGYIGTTPDESPTTPDSPELLSPMLVYGYGGQNGPSRDLALVRPHARLWSSPSCPLGTQYLDCRTRGDQPTLFAGCTTRNHLQQQRDCFIWHCSGCMFSYSAICDLNAALGGGSLPAADTIAVEEDIAFALVTKRARLVVLGQRGGRII